MIGGPFIKGWSRTQSNVTTSSAEAELGAMVKGSAELLGLRSLMMDLGRDSSGAVYADSSAALAVAKRKGAGMPRHTNVSSLWIQERQDKGSLEYRKVLGTENPSDLMTKYLARQSIDSCMDTLGQARVAGRARVGLEVQGAGHNSTEMKVAKCYEVVDDWEGPPLCPGVVWLFPRKGRMDNLTKTYHAHICANSPGGTRAPGQVA